MEECYLYSTEQDKLYRSALANAVKTYTTSSFLTATTRVRFDSPLASSAAADLFEPPCLRLQEDDTGGGGKESGSERALVALSGKFKSAREPRILSAARS